MTPTKKLWAPWRMDYILSDKPTGCIFCFDLTQEPKDALVVFETGAALVMLNKFPYTSGHLMVAPKRHISGLEELTESESIEFFQLVKRSISVLKDEIAPEGFNIGMNLGKSAGAGIEDHIHMHIVPRWHGDTNFMPVVADTHVVPEHLSTIYDKLKARFS